MINPAEGGDFHLAKTGDLSLAVDTTKYPGPSSLAEPALVHGSPVPSSLRRRSSGKRALPSLTRRRMSARASIARDAPLVSQGWWADSSLAHVGKLMGEPPKTGWSAWTSKNMSSARGLRARTKSDNTEARALGRPDWAALPFGRCTNTFRKGNQPRLPASRFCSRDS